MGVRRRVAIVIALATVMGAFGLARPLGAAARRQSSVSWKAPKGDAYYPVMGVGPFYAPGLDIIKGTYSYDGQYLHMQATMVKGDPNAPTGMGQEDFTFLFTYHKVPYVAEWTYIPYPYVLTNGILFGFPPNLSGPKASANPCAQCYATVRPRDNTVDFWADLDDLNTLIGQNDPNADPIGWGSVLTKMEIDDYVDPPGVDVLGVNEVFEVDAAPAPAKLHYTL